jgi:hypothetical protein
MVAVSEFYDHSITTDRFIAVENATGGYLYPFGGDVNVES